MLGGCVALIAVVCAPFVRRLRGDELVHRDRARAGGV